MRARGEGELENFAGAEGAREVEKAALVLPDEFRVEHAADDIQAARGAPRAAHVGRLAVDGRTVGFAEVVSADDFGRCLPA